MDAKTAFPLAFYLTAILASPALTLTVKNSSKSEQTFAVDTGTQETVYRVPAGGEVEVRDMCDAGCAVSGPWGFSRFEYSNAVIETNGVSLVTTTNGRSAIASADTGANEAAKPRQRVKRRAAKPSPYFPGSFSILMYGAKG